ncbi:MAG: hypothetical protein ACMUIG_06305 [Thermoplasmatota archaeon]
MLAEYLNILFYFGALILLSYLLDRMWMYSMARYVYLVFAAPGIMIHELSHYAACKITGAKVTKVVLMSKTGGSVTHGKPKGGVLGQAFVSMAPFIGIPLVLILLGLMFDQFLGCEIIWEPDLDGNVGSVILNTIGSSFEMIYRNIVDLSAYWFVIYLLISASLTIALAPSKQDFKNAVWGLIAVLGGIFIWIVIILRIAPSWPFPILGTIFDMMGWIIVVGFVLSFIGMIIGMPFALIKYLRKKD